MKIEQFETSGKFRLDGGEWDVDNNVYLLHEGGRGLPHPQAPARHQERNDAEDDAEQDRLAQVDGHVTAADGGGQSAQPCQPAIRPRSTGIQGQQRQPAAGAGQAQVCKNVRPCRLDSCQAFVVNVRNCRRSGRLAA